MANLVLYILAVRRPPRWLFDRMIRRVEGSATPQKEYPRMATLLRTVYMGKRGIDHLRFMDFSIIPGWSGYVAWRLGLIAAWRRFVRKTPPRPERPGPESRQQGGNVTFMRRRPEESEQAAKEG